MYSLIRFLIGCLFALAITLVIKKFKIHKCLKTIIPLVMAVIVMVSLSFLPFENLFVTFNSPESAYKYVTFKPSEIVLIVEGEDCDLVIAREDASSYNKLIVPKNSNGWKIGSNLNLKTINQKMTEEAVIYVYQYKNTENYFICIADINNGNLDITDSLNSDFRHIEEAYYKRYYTFVTSINEPYSISINGQHFILYD